MTTMITGRSGVAENGDIYEVTFLASLGQLVATKVASGPQNGAAGTTAPAPPDVPPGFVPIDYGAAEFLADGTPLPGGTWQIEAGTLYAGSGGVMVRRVVIGG